MPNPIHCTPLDTTSSFAVVVPQGSLFGIFSQYNLLFFCFILFQLAVSCTTYYFPRRELQDRWVYYDTKNNAADERTFREIRKSSRLIEYCKLLGRKGYDFVCYTVSLRLSPQGAFFAKIILEWRLMREGLFLYQLNIVLRYVVFETISKSK